MTLARALSRALWLLLLLSLSPSLFLWVSLCDFALVYIFSLTVVLDVTLALAVARTLALTIASALVPALVCALVCALFLCRRSLLLSL